MMDGFNKHRHEHNPKEKEIHDKFKKEYIESKNSPNSIDRLIFGHPSNSLAPKDYLSDREKQIVLSAMQWLGSTVGQCFLNSCGFIDENSKRINSGKKS